MKLNFPILMLLIPGLLIGCSPFQKSNSTMSNSSNTPSELSPNVTVSQYQTVSSDVNKPKELGDWRVTLLPKEKQNGFDFYKVEYKFQGNLTAANVKVKLGNGNITCKEIAKGQGGIIGSTFPIDVKQIEISITWTVQNQSFSQGLTFNTDNKQLFLQDLTKH